MSRGTLSRVATVRIFDAHGGICRICGLKIHAERGEQFQIDHEKPLWLGGADTEENMRPLHVDCHSRKTGEEAGTRSKTDRVREKHLGIKPKRKWRWG